MFSSSSADIFYNPPQKKGRETLKGLSKRSGRYWPLSLLIREKFWKIWQNITQLPTESPTWKILKDLVKMSHSYLIHHIKYFEYIEYFEKFGEKEIMSLRPPKPRPPPPPKHNHKYVRICSYNTLYNTLLVRIIRIISWVLTMWLVSFLPLYIAMKRVILQFLVWSHKLWHKFIFPSILIVYYWLLLSVVSLSTHFAVLRPF